MTTNTSSATPDEKMPVVGGELYAPALADMIISATLTGGFALWLFASKNQEHKINLWISKANNFVNFIVALLVFLALGFSTSRGIYYCREAGYALSLGLLFVNVADFLWCCPAGYISAFLHGVVVMVMALFAALVSDQNDRIAMIVIASLAFASNMLFTFLSRHRNDLWAWIVILGEAAVGVVYLVLFILGPAWKGKIDTVGETIGVLVTNAVIYGVLQAVIAIKKQHMNAEWLHKRTDGRAHYGSALVPMPPQFFAAVPGGYQVVRNDVEVSM